jgi:hypothetical protein
MESAEEEEHVISFEAKINRGQKMQQRKDEKEESPQYATVMVGRAPLAKCDEADEDEEEEEEEMDNALEEKLSKIGQKIRKENNPNPDDFVVRMRAKKSARMASIQQQGPHQMSTSRFEQRISQIIESLQADAESLIQLQENEREGGGMRGYWTPTPRGFRGNHH